MGHLRARSSARIECQPSIITQEQNSGQELAADYKPDSVIAELQSRGGSCTPREMAEFVRKLESGTLGFKFSKHNFYRNVLRTFMNMGFIGKAPRLDRATMKTVMVYRPIEQPIPARRPDNPSFWHVAYEICSWWNSLMFSRGA